MPLLQKLGPRGNPAKPPGVPRRQREPRAHLPVHSPDDGGLDPHAADEADVEVLVQHEGLQAGADKQQRRVEVALPVWGLPVVHEADEQPVGQQGQSPTSKTAKCVRVGTSPLASAGDLLLSQARQALSTPVL